MNIVIFASIGSQNLGDELILKNEIKLLENEYGRDTKFYVFSYNPKNPFYIKNNIKYIEYFPIGIKKIKNIYKNTKNFIILLNTTIKSDLIIIGGGGIIYDQEHQDTNNPLKSRIFRTNIFRFFRKKFNFFAVGLNIKNEKNLDKVKKIFNKANYITVRDIYSKNLLKKIGINSEKLLDPVFYDNAFKINKKKNLIKRENAKSFNYKVLENINLEGKTVGIALRSGYLNNNNTKLGKQMEEGLINELLSFIKKNGGKILLLPHSFHESDTKANDYIFLNTFRKNNPDIKILNSMRDVYNTYKSESIDICLSMRLHSIILSQVYNIPFIGISYSTKTDEILDYIENTYE